MVEPLRLSHAGLLVSLLSLFETKVLKETRATFTPRFFTVKANLDKEPLKTVHTSESWESGI